MSATDHLHGEDSNLMCDKFNVTNSMELGPPCEANNNPDTQEIARILCNKQQVHSRVNNSPPLV
jgi:hypothetical protein